MAVNPQTAIENLEAALAAGVLRVRIGDRDVQYQSAEEIRNSIRYFQSKLDGATAANTKQIKVSYSKGD